MSEAGSGYIGRSIKPEKSRRFLTGNGLYVADIRLPEMLHAAVVRSTHAHARIRSIDKTEALQVHGEPRFYLCCGSSHERACCAQLPHEASRAGEYRRHKA